MIRSSQNIPDAPHTRQTSRETNGALTRKKTNKRAETRTKKKTKRVTAASTLLQTAGYGITRGLLMAVAMHADMRTVRAIVCMGNRSKVVAAAVSDNMDKIVCGFVRCTSGHKTIPRTYGFQINEHTKRGMECKCGLLGHTLHTRERASRGEADGSQNTERARKHKKDHARGQNPLLIVLEYHDKKVWSM